MLYVTETLTYLGPKSRNLVPFDIRDYVTEKIFHQKIKKWKPGRCREFLTNKLWFASYKLRVTIYCTSYEYSLRTSYELLFIARIGILMLIM